MENRYFGFSEQELYVRVHNGGFSALYGRSLATFKRDFKKISDLTPEKWLIRKRLEVAYNLMKDGGNKVVDVYTKVGFRNQSHFSAAFKKQYGIAPTAVAAIV